MKILVVGGGGREHALVWQLKRSPQVGKVFCAPGNAGIAADAECVNISYPNFYEDLDNHIRKVINKCRFPRSCSTVN